MNSLFKCLFAIINNTTKSTHLSHENIHLINCKQNNSMKYNKLNKTRKFKLMYKIKS
jgi:hypothetical protein